jgi:hypothetical protein
VLGSGDDDGRLAYRQTGAQEVGDDAAELVFVLVEADGVKVSRSRLEVFHGVSSQSPV